MKKNIICIVLIILAATGCEKFLNQAPTGEQTKEYIFQDYIRAQRYMDRLYEYLPGLWTENGSTIGKYGFLEVTDMAEYTANYEPQTPPLMSVTGKTQPPSIQPLTTAEQIRRCFITLKT